MTNELNALLAHYKDASEETRLNTPWGKLEFQRTQYLIKKYLPEPPAVILDVGGAAGIYSLWLASEGYIVHLIDLVPKHIEQGLLASRHSQYPFASASVGDARSLQQQNESVDAVLFLGPLYHLPEKSDRIKALMEAYRVLKPSGVIFAVGISRFASALDGLWRKLLDDPPFAAMVEQDLKNGQHRNPTNNPEYFTDAYFHLPEELITEVEEVGFKLQMMSAIEGPAWLLPELTYWQNDVTRHKILMTILEKIGQNASLMGISSHFMAIGRKF